MDERNPSSRHQLREIVVLWVRTYPIRVIDACTGVNVENVAYLMLSTVSHILGSNFPEMHSDRPLRSEWHYKAPLEP